jgi:hypothetical protein
MAPQRLLAFCLPSEILTSLSTRQPQEAEELPALSEEADDEVVEEIFSSGLFCSVCGIKNFESVIEQRLHFKTDFHRFNLKMKLKGKESVKEEDWENMVESE